MTNGEAITIRSMAFSEGMKEADVDKFTNNVLKAAEETGIEPGKVAAVLLAVRRLPWKELLWRP